MEIRKPFVVNNTGHTEWFTPQVYIDAVKAVMGDIDLDPASCDEANQIIQARRYFTKEEDGLKQRWFGRIFMNPPYRQRVVSRFIEKLIVEFTNRNIAEAIVLTNNATETKWFQDMLDYSNAVCFHRGRIRFVNEKGNIVGAPLQGQVFFYLGDNALRFCRIFGSFGRILIPNFTKDRDVAQNGGAPAPGAGG